MTPVNYHAYAHVASQGTENKEKILLMLYGGAVKFVRFARRGIEKNNPKIKGENISKILAILAELDCALDKETGGILAENLSVLYQYMMGRLTVANIKNDAGALDEVERLLNELKQGFEEAINQEADQSSVQAIPEEPAMQKGVRVAI